MAVLIGLLNVTLTGALAVLVLLARDRLHLGSVGYGLLFTFVAVGGIVGYSGRLIGPAQLAGEIRREHPRRVAAGTMQHQHRLPGRLADGGVAKPQFGHRLAGMKFKIAGNPVAWLRCRIAGCCCGSCQCKTPDSGACEHFMMLLPGAAALPGPLAVT